MPREQERLQLIQLPSTEIQNLLTDLGIIQPPSLIYLSNVVQPVSIVDSRITVAAEMVPVTGENFNGSTVAIHGAGVVLADMGAQPAGTYWFTWHVTHHAANFGEYQVQRRDAANAANIWFLSHDYTESYAGTMQWQQLTVKINANERIRIITVGGMTGTGWGGMFWKRVN